MSGIHDNLNKIIHQWYKLAFNLNANDYLYHVTFFKNIENISINGLIGGSGQLLGHGGNTGRSFGKIFLTDYNGVSHWYSKIEDMAEYHSDNILEDEAVPVVLRTLKFDEDEEDSSAEGFGYSNQSEFVRTEVISPEELEIWDGNQWLPIDEYESVDIEKALIKEQIPEEELRSEEDEDFINEEAPSNFYYYFKYTDQNPLANIK